jgi:hypothetical protein
MKVTILIGRKSNSLFDEKEESTFNGNYDRTNLVLDSWEDAHKIASIAKINCYRIMKLEGKYDDFNYSDTPIFETEDITAFWNRVKKDSEDYDAIQNKRVEIINAWPEYIDYGAFGIEGVKVRIKRNKYSYNKAYSRKLNGYSELKITFEGNEQRNSFTPEDYFTNAGHVQLKKFKDDFFWATGIKKEGLPPDFDYKRFLLKAKSILQDYRAKIRATVKQTKEVNNGT